MTAAPLLRVTSLATGYGDLRVVRDVDLQVHAGAITVLLGRNGAGKTTTLRGISGLSRVSAGRVELDGRDITSLAPHRRVAAGMSYVQEGKRIFHEQTVEQNLLLGGYPRTRRLKVLRGELGSIYELFPVLADKRRASAGSLSGGQQQMLAIGQAIMASPRLLLLDEPSGGLAPVIVREVMERIGVLKERGLGVLLVEQALEASLEFAERFVIIDMGVVVQQGTTDRILDTRELREAYFGRSSADGD